MMLVVVHSWSCTPWQCLMACTIQHTHAYPSHNHIQTAHPPTPPPYPRSSHPLPHRDVHNDTLRILRFAIDEFVNNETAAKANDFMDFIMDRLFQYHPAEPSIGAAPPSPLPEHLAKGAKKVCREYWGFIWWVV